MGSRYPSSGDILDIEAGHLAVAKTEDVPDGLVLKSVSLLLKWSAVEIVDGLTDFRDDRAIGRFAKAQGLYVGTDDRPLARPVIAYGRVAVDVATIHTVGPGDIVGKSVQYPINVPRIEAIVNAAKESDIVVHWLFPCLMRTLRPEFKVFTYARML